jgi:hypothetical protein
MAACTAGSMCSWQHVQLAACAACAAGSTCSRQHVQLAACAAGSTRSTHPVCTVAIPWCAFFCLYAIIFRNVTPMMNEELMYNKNYIICTPLNAFHIYPQHRESLTYWLLRFKGVCVRQKKLVSLTVFKRDIFLDIHEYVCPNKQINYEKQCLQKQVLRQ